MDTATKLLTILTGDRPTGPLHLGHLVGSLEARVRLQHQHRQFVLIADAQALTDNVADPGKIGRNILELMADYLAVGIEPDQTAICLQSEIPALAELAFYLLNLVTVARLERNPTVREEIRERGFERNIPAGFLAYPVSQAADITAFDAALVPVGADQLPVIEQAQEIVRRCNALFGETLTMPEGLISETPRLIGIDGAGKMGKSAGNAIPLGIDADALVEAVNSMFTDPGHIRISNPGRVEGNVVFAYLEAFDPDKAEVARLMAHYRAGGLGDVALKRRLAGILEQLLAPIRERRRQFASDPGQLVAILKAGTEKAMEIASQTALRLRRNMGLGFAML
jgi:tryptophanyl-tRNA synthetase